MNLRAASALCLLLLAVAARLSAALEHDLGNNLAYLRVTDAAADQAVLTEAIEKKPALVIDLRAVSADRDQAAAVRDVLAKPTRPTAVRIVLVNSATSPALITAISGPLPKVLTLGPTSSEFSTDIAIRIAEDEDRRAFAALTDGVPLQKLINGALEKRRYDEAELVKAHAGEPVAAASPDDAEETADPTETDPAEEKKNGAEQKKKEAPPPLIDLVLQRAIQIHRALATFGKA